MKKDRPVRIMALVACALIALNVFINCMFVIFPETAISLYNMFVSYDYTMQADTFGSAVPFLIIKELFPVALFVIALVNALSGTFTQNKGIITAVLAVVYNIVGNIVSAIFYNLAVKACYGASEVSLLSMVNLVMNWINRLNFWALLLVISSAVIEIYASSKFTQEK